MSEIIFDDKYFDKLDEKLFTEDEIAIRDAVRAVMMEKFMPFINKWDEGDIRPFKSKEELAKYFIRTLAQEVGIFGSNLNMEDVIEGFPGPISETAYGIISREVEAVDSAFRSSVSVQSGLTMWGINKYGSLEQRKLWLPKLYTGEKLGAFGLTEPQGGSNPALMKVTAKKDGSDWILNGTKAWITNGSIADVNIVYARCEDGGIRGFLVEKGAPGFTTSDYEKWSLRCAVASALYFNNVRIPKENLMPGTDNGKLRNALSHLTQARYTICWGGVGAAMVCFKEAREFALNRKMHGGEPLAKKQAIQLVLARMFNRLENIYLKAWRLGRMKDELKDDLPHQEVVRVKFYNIDTAYLIACDSVNEILSADGLTFEMHSGRHMTGLQSVRKYEGAHLVIGLMTGEAITGEKAY